jgi:hypothetical protein
MTTAFNSFYINLPPKASGKNAMQSAVTGVAAATAAVFTSLSDANQPKGKCWVTFESLTTDTYVMFKASGAAAVTTATGTLIAAGTKESFWLCQATDILVDHIAPSGAGRLKWYVSSPPSDLVALHG